MTLEEFLHSKGVPIAGRNHKHFKSGWVHMCCIFCGDRGYHLGFAETVPVGHCFKCGKHGLTETIAAVVKCTKGQASRYVDQILGSPTLRGQKEEEPELEEIVLPFGKPSYQESRHMHYLEERGYDPYEIEREWNITYIGSIGSYPWSIIIPVNDEEGKLVSWQARDITGKAKAKYRSKKDTNIKRVLYGLDGIKPETKKVIVVEGVTDAWRFGRGCCVATFGQDWSDWQLSTLVRRFETVCVLFDNEPEAVKNSRRLCDSILAMGVFSIGFFGDYGAKDPGSMSQEDADEIKEFLFEE